MEFPACLCCYTNYFYKLAPFFAYSTRYIAAKIPNGTAIKSDSSVIISVLISAGIRDAFLNYIPVQTAPVSDFLHLLSE